ncbi:hypothetical protein M0R04_06505 [Candidatus Dojkabacteria bacterium]|jgi:hypothetical protein|nr:hypothetical protein [Candidatus Dojkabacteria bacterium]
MKCPKKIWFFECSCPNHANPNESRMHGRCNNCGHEVEGDPYFSKETQEFVQKLIRGNGDPTKG